MKLDKAIENLKEEAEFEQGEKNLTMVDSINLGIEALKRLQQVRSHHTYPAYKLLPGETVE